MDPETLDEYSEEDSLALAELLTTSGNSLTDAQMESLASNIPENIPYNRP